MMLIRPDKSKMNPYFLMRSLYSEKIQNEMHTRGSGVTAKHLNVADVKRLKIPIPPLPVQNKITSILSSIDQKLAAKTIPQGSARHPVHIAPARSHDREDPGQWHRPHTRKDMLK
jgi:restriction endonuclease S subunit